MDRPEEKTIVLIEDSDEDFETIEWMLKKTGYEFVLKRFSYAEDAIKYLETNDLPSIILLDLNLSGLGGLEILKVLKADDRVRLVPIVVITTSSDPKDINSCYRHGASGYVNKPVNFEKFSKAVHILMDYWFQAVILP